MIPVGAGMLRCDCRSALLGYAPKPANRATRITERTAVLIPDRVVEFIQTPPLYMSRNVMTDQRRSIGAAGASMQESARSSVEFMSPRRHSELCVSVVTLCLITPIFSETSSYHRH